jgi:hypothetical protein
MVSCNYCHQSINKIDYSIDPIFKKHWLEKRASQHSRFEFGLSFSCALLAGSVVAISLKVFVIPFIVVCSTALLATAIFAFVFYRSSQFKNDLYHAIAQKQIHDFEKYKPQGKPVALVLSANCDSNGAIEKYFPSELEPAYQLVFKKVCGLDDCINTIKSIANIHLLWIQAHGDKDRILFHENVQEKVQVGLLNSSLEAEEVKSLYKLIPPTIPIVLQSCYAGSANDDQGKPGFAKTFSKQLPTNPIYAGTRAIHFSSIDSGRLRFQDFFKRNCLVTYLAGEKCRSQPLVQASKDL